MRIITGRARRLKLTTPKNWDVRPTADRVKESLFNIIGSKIIGAQVLDLFAGTGNLGLESWSRGAEKIVFTDTSKESLRLVESNIAKCRAQEDTETICGDACQLIGRLHKKGMRFDFVFADPPYNKGLVQKVIAALAESPLLNDAYMRRAGLSSASTTTCGADEIAQMLIARRFCQINNYKPKFYIEYTTGSAATAIMPYMAVTAEAALLDKIKFTGGTLTQNLNEADVILYVHCGSAKEPANEKMAQKLQTLLNSGKHVAVIDASEDYESSQMLLPVLLANNITINKLVSYSAWNTFGNAAGTATAQSAIFTGQLKRLPKHLLPALYAQNLNFTVARLLDDYSYQKLLHHRLSTILTLRGQDPANLNDGYKTLAENIIEGFIYNEKRSLLYTNLGLTPFYSNGADEYYLTGINAETKLPWNRIFEIELKTNCEYGIKKSAQ